VFLCAEEDRERAGDLGNLIFFIFKGKRGLLTETAASQNSARRTFCSSRTKEYHKKENKMGGGNAQKTAISRARHLEKEKGAGAGEI
jgi:hypothetical protein